ncbi:hypothetical protein [Microtetraspora sp. NBRC 16547]|uniref:hypothetical protein n=1 Tax=Microtetraspora sp. NBRC 16547 TaxID=3030993 RepID=UPI0024A2D5DC|nr:hypothetical protein [Microtetraspora sp. NBRC 16547]GLX02605.1 hypothetical protein Misp02_66910 [Microtetraspora sp. NBRC 16547]
MAADNCLNGFQLEDDRLARGLRDAHRRVRALDVSLEERTRLTHRLLAICNVAKQDIEHATARLDAFIAYLDGVSDTPSGRNAAAGD